MTIIWGISGCGLLGAKKDRAHSKEQKTIHSDKQSNEEQPNETQSIEKKENSRDDKSVAGVKNLDSELLYDLVLGLLAESRGENKTALDTMSRAAYYTRDTRIAVRATKLALQLKDYQRAIELSRFRVTLEPDNYYAKLTVIYAQLALGQHKEAIENLFAVLGSLSEHDTSIMQAVADTLTTADFKTDFDPIEEYDRLAVQHEDSAIVHYIRAVIAVRIRNKQAFTNSIDRTLKLKPEWTSPAILKLHTLKTEGSDQLDKFASDFLQRNPDASEFRIRYGQILIEQEKYEMSAQQFEEVLSLDDKNDETRYTLGIVYYELGKLKKSSKLLHQFLERNPNHDQTRLYLAEIATKKKRYKEAITLLREVDSSIFYFDAQLKIGQIQSEMSGTDAGVDYLRQIDVRDDDQLVRIHIEQASMYQDVKKLDKAKIVLDEGLLRLPEHPDLLYSRGLLAAQLNMLVQHEKDMRLLIEKQPDNAQALNALGFTLADITDRYDEAFELIENALTLAPNDPYILDSMGWVLYRQGKHKDSLEYLRQAIKIMQDAEIAAHLGEVLWVTGKKTEARKIWNQGRKWGPGNQTLNKTMKRLLKKNEGKTSLNTDQLSLHQYALAGQLSLRYGV